MFTIYIIPDFARIFHATHHSGVSRIYFPFGKRQCFQCPVFHCSLFLQSSDSTASLSHTYRLFQYLGILHPNSFETGVSYSPLISGRLQILTWFFSTLHLENSVPAGEDRSELICLFSVLIALHHQPLVLIPDIVLSFLTFLGASSSLFSNIPMALTHREKFPGPVFASWCRMPVPGLWSKVMENGLGSRPEVVGASRLGPNNWWCSGGRGPLIRLSVVVPFLRSSRLSWTVLIVWCPCMFFSWPDLCKRSPGSLGECLVRRTEPGVCEKWLQSLQEPLLPCFPEKKT